MPIPLKVLQVYRTFFPDTQGGAEETIRQLAVGLKNIDVECRVFVPSREPDPEIVEVSGVKVFRSKMHFEVASCGFALGAFSEFRRQVEWADVVHYHFPWPFADMLDVLGRVRKPTIVTYHSDIVRQAGLMKLYQPLMNRFLKKARYVVATSQQYASSSEVLKELDNVEVVPIGIDEASYPTPNESTQNEVRTQYGQDYFLFVGMLRYYKGLDVLLDAVKETSMKVVIAGAGPEEARLKNRVRAEGLDNVRFAGRVSDVEKIALIDHSLAMVFPSHLRSEAFGVSLLESLMRGKPLITAEVGTGTSYVNQMNETGLIVDAGNAQELKKAMLTLENDPAATRQFGAKGRARFERLFTSRLMADGYRRLYHSSVSGMGS